MTPVSILPLSVLPWQRVVERIFSGSLISVCDYDNWVVRSPSVEMKVPAVAMRTRYHRPYDFVRFKKEYVFLRDRYTCQYCHRVFPAGELTLDHVNPRKYGGEINWQNATTACSPCNARKGHNRSVLPNRMPRQPSYHELVAISREYKIRIPHPSWNDYLMWPEENLIHRNQKNNIVIERPDILLSEI